MPATTRRNVLMTFFGVIGFFWFLLHAVEYVYARYDGLQATLPLPDQLGLMPLFGALPQWAGIALTACIWLGLLGSVLLVLQDRAAVLILSLTLLASLPVLVWAVLSFVEGLASLGRVNLMMFAGGQVTMALGLWLYARTARRFNLF